MQFVDWINVPVYRRARRIDVVLTVLAAVCVGYYWWTGGWFAALIGGLTYALFVMLGLWFL